VSDRVLGQRPADLIDGVHPCVIVHRIIVVGLPVDG
jgi:hypothetical protein